MISISLTWASFSEMIITSGVSIKYAFANDNYYLYIILDETEYSCILHCDGNENQLDFEENYKDNATRLN